MIADQVAIVRYIRVALLVLCVSGVADVKAQSGGCELLTKDGVADTSSTMTDNEIAASYRRWFCDKRFSAQSETESYSLNGALPFKGIPVKLGFDANRDNWSTWTREICSDERSDLWAKSLFVQDLKKINVELAKVIKDCVLGQKGLFVWLERTSENKFKLVARFDTPLTKVRDVSLTFSVDSDAVCEGQLRAFRLNSPNEHRWLCSRRKDKHDKYSTDAVQIVANSPDAPPIWGNSLALPEVYRPPLPGKPGGVFPMYVTAAMLENCITRGGSDQQPQPPAVCAGADITLAGVYIDRGVIRTQTCEGQKCNGHSEVSFAIPPGAHRLLFSVGNPYLGEDCGDPTKHGMIMKVDVDEVTKWEGQIAWHGYALSGEIPLRAGAKKIRLLGNTGDGTVNCDDSAWAQVRFDE
jgi:hypothetical protein